LPALSAGRTSHTFEPYSGAVISKPQRREDKQRSRSCTSLSAYRRGLWSGGPFELATNTLFIPAARGRPTGTRYATHAAPLSSVTREARSAACSRRRDGGPPIRQPAHRARPARRFLVSPQPRREPAPPPAQAAAITTRSASTTEASATRREPTLPGSP